MANENEAPRPITYALGGWPTVSGSQEPSVILDAEDDTMIRVYTFGNVGSGTPEPVFHGRHLVLGSVPVEADVDSLRAVLETCEDEIRDLAGRYLGTRWDGHNHRGRWDLSDEEREVFPVLDLSEVATYWDAGEWLAPAMAETLDAALKHATIAAAVEEIVDDAARESVLLDPDDVERVLRDAIEAVREDMAVVETMPDSLRGRHRAARNWGVWPQNGAERSWAHREDAEAEIEADADGYAHIIAEPWTGEVQS